VPGVSSAEPTPEGEQSPARPACTPIHRLPFTIDVPGRYCLAEDLSLYPMPGDGPRLHAPAALKVLADDVTIDLSGHVLNDHTLGMATNALAVRAHDRKRLTVTNGTVRGFFIGVAMVGDKGESVSVHDVRFEEVRYAAVHFNKVRGFDVRDNQLVNMGHGSAWYMPHAMLVSGEGTIAGNVIDVVRPNVRPHGDPPRIDTEAISVKEGNVTIERNTIANIEVPDGQSWGIRVSRGARATITHNSIHNFKTPVAYTLPDGSPWQNDDNLILQ
jgi:hypothetical protein